MMRSLHAFIDMLFCMIRRGADDTRSRAQEEQTTAILSGAFLSYFSRRTASFTHDISPLSRHTILLE